MQTYFLSRISNPRFWHSNEAKLRKAKGRRRSSGGPVQKNGGAERDRTADPLLAKQVLSQLSYSPIFRLAGKASKNSQTVDRSTPGPARSPAAIEDREEEQIKPEDARAHHELQRMVGPGRLELPTSRLSGVRSNHLSYGPIR